MAGDLDPIGVIRTTATQLGLKELCVGRVRVVREELYVFWPVLWQFDLVIFWLLVAFELTFELGVYRH